MQHPIFISLINIEYDCSIREIKFRVEDEVFALNVGENTDQYPRVNKLGLRFYGSRKSKRKRREVKRKKSAKKERTGARKEQGHHLRDRATYEWAPGVFFFTSRRVVEIR